MTEFSTQLATLHLFFTVKAIPECNAYALFKFKPAQFVERVMKSIKMKLLRLGIPLLPVYDISDNIFQLFS